ncbi:MAG: hypothetical protein FJ033_07250 [Chloroflexi bacterium]|nr:hypothetical protein [Chloroflexota bacterium]
MTDQQEAVGRQITYDVGERPVAGIVGALLLAVTVLVIGIVPIIVGFNSERRDPGGYHVLGVLTGLGHIVLGLLFLVEVLLTVANGRGRTLLRLAHALGRKPFLPTLDFLIGLIGIGFGTILMFAYTQTIADLPRLPRYALGYTMDGWLGIWIVWVSVLGGILFWSLWIDAVLGRDPRPQMVVELPEYDDEEEE